MIEEIDTTILDGKTIEVNGYVRDADDEIILITDAEHYGGTDICIGNHCLTWRDVDKLKEMIALAEKLMKKNP